MTGKTEKKEKFGGGTAQIWLLILVDVIFINLAAFLALFIRLEFSWTDMMQEVYLKGMLLAAIPATLLSIGMFAIFRIYNSMWQFAGTQELSELALSCAASGILYYVCAMMFGYHLPRSFPILMMLVLFVLTAFVRFMLYSFYGGGFSFKNSKNRKRTMVIGAGQGASMAIKEFMSSRNSQNLVVCAIDDDKSKHGMRVRGIKVVGGREKIEDAVKKYGVEEIVFCIPSAPGKMRNELLEICSRTGAKLKILPALSQLVNGEVSIRQMRDVNIDDLLERPQIHTDDSVIAKKIQGKTVLVTGGGGSIGSELCRQIARLNPQKLIIFDIYENNAYYIQQELKRELPNLNLEVLIGSVRDKERIRYIFDTYRPEVVFHAAAHKHVPLMEDSPGEAIKNNVFGTYNVAKTAGEFGTKLFILISSDKAVNPTNVMGATKRVCEMIVQSMNACYQTVFIAVRFGNVMGSSGSVIPLFKKQIESGGPVTVTDKRVTRYFMTIPEAVSLILQAGAFAQGGEVFVLDMGRPVKIDDMARKMIRLSGFEPDVDIEIKYIGLRPGEKLYEELLLSGEGIQKTDNDLIYIGHQAIYTEEQINEKLNALRDVLTAPNWQIRDRVLEVIKEPEDKIYSYIEIKD